jgi:hypothetical protein
MLMPVWRRHITKSGLCFDMFWSWGCGEVGGCGLEFGFMAELKLDGEFVTQKFRNGRKKYQ